MSLAIVFAASEAWASEGLVLVPDPLKVGLLITLFALLIIPLNALLFRPVLRVLDARDDKIEGTRRRAESLSADADEVLDRYEASIRDVREEAERGRKQLLDTARGQKADRASRARAEAEGEIQNARNEVADALADARASLRRDAELLANEAATRVLGRTLA